MNVQKRDSIWKCPGRLNPFQVFVVGSYFAMMAVATRERAASHAGRLGRNRASKRCLQCARNVGVLYLLTIRGSVGHFLLNVCLCAAQGQRRLREKPRAKN
jgi:hypothetical protein